MAENNGKSVWSSLPFRIAMGLVIGAVLGVAARSLAGSNSVNFTVGGETWSAARLVDFIATQLAQPVGQIFLNMMFLVIIPLIFSSLALGVLALGDLRTIGRLGGRILVGTLVLSGVGVLLGVGLVNLVEPGKRIGEESRALLIAGTQNADVEKSLSQAQQAKSLGRVISDSISRNPIEDMANVFNPNPNYNGGGILAVLVTAMLVGLALAAVTEAQRRPLVELFESLQALSIKIIDFAMVLAPFGVAALIFQTTARIGLQLFPTLFAYIACVLGGLLLHLLGTYSVLLATWARRSPLRFFRDSEEVIITAFSTSSSNATLPTSLRVAVEKLGMPKAESSFVLTVGSTANQNGTALFEGITVLFLAQFYGIDLSVGQQITVVMMSIMAGVGTAGVPGGSLPVIALLLQSIGVPAAGIGVILGVDRLLDMSRTVINVVGDLVLTAMVSPRGEPQAVSEALALQPD